MFQFPRFASTAYVFSRRWFRITGTGFPHSEISGFTLARSYPELIAACHVLHRLSVPRHPPHALSSLAENISRESPRLIASKLPRNRRLQPGRLPSVIVANYPDAQYSIFKELQPLAPPAIPPGFSIGASANLLLPSIFKPRIFSRYYHTFRWWR
jgi:hypothetical protein